MIGDGVNDVPALKQARLAVAMGSGSQITKGVADIVLLRDQFSMLPRAVAEGRRIARNIHRLGRLYLTKSVYAGFLILLAAIFDFTFPFLPRQLTVAALLTIGIPSFVLALAPSEGPLYRGRLLKALAAFAFPAGIAMGIASLLSFFFVDSVFGGTLEEGRTAATTTLIVLGLCFIVLLERGPGREHITVQSYMLAMIAVLGALFAGILAIEPVREFFDLALLAGGQWFVALLCVAIGLGLAGAAWQLPYVQRLELAEGAELEPDDGPEPTHTPRTGEFDAVAPEAADRQPRDPTEPLPQTVNDHRRTKIVATIGPATRSVDGHGRADRGRRRRLPASTSRTAPRDDHAENVGDGARGRRAHRQARSGSSATCPGPKLRIGDVEDGIVGLRPGSEIVLTTEDCVGHRRAALGLLRRAARGGRPPTTSSTSPTAASACGCSRPATTRSAARSRSAAASPRTRASTCPAPRSACRRPGARTSPGSTSRSSRGSTCSRSPSCAAPRTSRRSSAGCAPAAPTSR